MPDAVTPGLVTPRHLKQIENMDTILQQADGRRSPMMEKFYGAAKESHMDKSSSQSYSAVTPGESPHTPPPHLLRSFDMLTDSDDTDDEDPPETQKLEAITPQKKGRNTLSMKHFNTSVKMKTSPRPDFNPETSSDVLEAPPPRPVGVPRLALGDIIAERLRCPGTSATSGQDTGMGSSASLKANRPSHLAESVKRLLRPKPGARQGGTQSVSAPGKAGQHKACGHDELEETAAKEHPAGTCTRNQTLI